MSTQISDRASAYKNTVFMLLTLTFALVAAFFFISSGDIAHVFRTSAPDGQFLYLLSKSLGLTALCLFWWQSFSSLIFSSDVFNRTRFSKLKAGRSTHIAFGILLALLIISHASIFISAVSLRQDSLAVYLLIPDFSGFYQTALSLGVVALFAIIIAVVLAATRKHLKNVWLYGHRFVLLAFGLAAIHAILIGSEVGDGILKYLILFFILSIIVAFLSGMRIFKKDSQ